VDPREGEDSPSILMARVYGRLDVSLQQEMVPLHLLCTGIQMLLLKLSAVHDLVKVHYTAKGNAVSQKNIQCVGAGFPYHD